LRTRRLQPPETFSPFYKSLQRLKRETHLPSLLVFAAVLETSERATQRHQKKKKHQPTKKEGKRERERETI
jgi:hypothetical protein